MAKELGFAVVGAGVIGEAHATAVDRVKGAKLVSIADVIPERAEQLASKFDHEVFFTDNADDAINRDDVDVVCVCTPSGSHLTVIRTAAYYKKHILAEKPLEITVGRIDKAVQLANDAEVKLACIFQTRYKPAVRATREAIAAGRLGQITLVDANTKWFRSQEYYDTSGWRGTWMQDGGGALMNQSIHSIDAIQWLIQPIGRIKWIWAKVSTIAHRMETEDTAAAIFELDNGALGTIEGATSVWPSSAVSLEVRGFKGTITMKDGVIEKWILEDAEEGEEERMKALPEYDDPGNRVEGFDDLGWWKGHALQIADFVDAINGDADAPIPGSEGRDAVEIIRAIYLSSKKGQRVELPLEKDF